MTIVDRSYLQPSFLRRPAKRRKQLKTKAKRLHPTQRQRYDWDNIDWHCTDSEIAREFEGTRERVRQMRLKLGKRRTPDRLEICVRDLAARDLSDVTLKDMLETFGYGVTTLREALALLRYKPGRDYKPRPKFIPKPSARKYDWDNVDWENKFDSQIARELGCAAATVTMTRKRLDFPRGPDGRRVSPRRFHPKHGGPHSLGLLSRRIVQLMQDNHPAWFTFREVIDHFNIAESTAGQRLNYLWKTGRLERKQLGGLYHYRALLEQHEGRACRPGDLWMPEESDA